MDLWPTNAIANALTVDVEDYYQVSGFERDVRRENWANHPSRVVPNTLRILEILDGYQIQGTFFVLGWVAEHYPALVSEIDAAGHEIGSHSYWHHLVYRQKPGEFRDDLCRSRDILQDIISKPVTTYRAPSFSITQKSLWAIEILAEEGFTIDSSVFPIYHHRCGIPGAPRHPYVHQTKVGELWEFPASVAHIGRANLPISGGGYFRLLPLRLTRRLLQQLNVRSQQPFVFYIHPWELDPEQPRLKAGSSAMRFRHYVNLKSTEHKFKQLLKMFSFDRMDAVLRRYSVATNKGDKEAAGTVSGTTRNGVVNY